MQHYKVRITSTAFRDIDRIADYHLMRVGPNSAEAITDKLLDTISLLADSPFLGTLHSDPFLAERDYRKLLCKDYVCIYRVVDDTVFVYRVVNGRMDYPKLLY
jgi:plasmid stabilization system protein ParE